MEKQWYQLETDETLSALETSGESGLEDSEGQKRIAKYGKNQLKEGKKETLFEKIIKQFKDYLVLILIGASIISAITGDIVEAIVIILIVIVNATLGIMQEGQAEEAMAALKKMSAPNAKVIRNNMQVVLPSEDLVPGDVVMLEAGDIIPADMRLINTANMKVDEASLTGESVPSEKHANMVLHQEAGIGDRKNMAYMSSVVTYGRGKGVVVATGDNTEMGKIADVIKNTVDEATPLQKKLDELGKILGSLCLVVCIIVFIVGFLRGEGTLIEMLMIGVSLAVAAIPEGLPAVVTIVLAMGMKKMAKRNAIVKRLLAVETLGCVSVICSDKTGTLTQNEMTVVKLYAGNADTDIEGIGYAPVGKMSIANDEMKLLLNIGVLCNDASLVKKDNSAWGIIGDPTEAALIVSGAKAGYEKVDLNKKYVRVQEIPFDSERKMMTTFHTGTDIANVVSYTKGAPDIILDRCSHIMLDGKIVIFDDAKKQEVLANNSKFAHRALRVLAFAFKAYEQVPNNISSENVENDMILVGLMGMIDPARVEAADAIRVCRDAGIKPVMITGDFKDTAVAIAKDLDLMREGDGVLSGDQLEKMSDEELREAVKVTSVYARVSPEHKVKIVTALKQNGHIAAMTGDGVNDAMALKRSDIGVSMGITGTDVAKSTADIVLTDDNFASIVSAVEEGRIIYSNIRKFVYFLLSCNVGEILIVFISILLGWPIPLLPIQLLWLNLVTDSFPAMALGTEAGDPDIMKQKPRNAKESIIDKTMLVNIIIQSVALCAAVLFSYKYALDAYGLETARTYAFATLIGAELLRAFSSRSERFSVFKIGVFKNKIMVYAVAVSFVMMIAVLYLPLLQNIFSTVSLGVKDWQIIGLLALVPFLAGEMNKFFRVITK